MDLATYQQQCASREVFSRGALQLTFRIMRKKKPAIALQIQNCLAVCPLEKPQEIENVPATDHFKVELAAETLRDLLFGLSELVEERDNKSDLNDLGSLVTLRTLISDWLAYAQPYLD